MGAALDWKDVRASPATAPTRLTARAPIVGERIDTAGLEAAVILIVLELIAAIVQIALALHGR